MRHYELVVVLSPMLNQEQSTDTWERIKGFISNRNGEIVREEAWGTRRLAYPIRKGSYQFLEGTYHLTLFSTETPFNQELATFLRLDEQVLRSLVVVAEPPKPEAEPAIVEAPAEVEEAVAEAAVAEATAEVEEAVAEADAEPAVAEAPAEVEEPVAEAEAEPAVAEAPAEVEEPEPFPEETEEPDKAQP